MAPVSHAVLTALVVSAAAVAHAQGGRTYDASSSSKWTSTRRCSAPWWPSSSACGPSEAPRWGGPPAWLAPHYGLQHVGDDLSAAAILSIIGLLATRETKDEPL